MHDGSFSLCVHYPSGPPNRWFFRNSLDDMAAFVIDAHDRLKNGECETFRTALESIDPGITRSRPSRRLALHGFYAEAFGTPSGFGNAGWPWYKFS